MSLHFSAFKHFVCIFGRKGRGKTVYTKHMAKHLRRFIILDTTCGLLLQNIGGGRDTEASFLWEMRSKHYGSSSQSSIQRSMVLRGLLLQNIGGGEIMSLHFSAFKHFVCIFGRKGRGKTIYTKHMAKHLRRFIILDTTWQLGELGYVIHYPDRLIQAFKHFGKVPQIIYQPMKYDDESFDRFFASCLHFSNYTLIIDEVDRFARPRHYISDNLREIVNRGRVQGIGLIVNSRRPASTHMDLRSNSNYVVCFHLHETRDVEYVAEWIGASKQAIKALEGHESLLYSADSGTVIHQRPCPI